MSMDNVRFQKNLERWAIITPEGANEVAATQCPNVSFAVSGNGLANLKCTMDGKTFYIHSEQDPIAEAKRWFSAISLEDIDILYVYGVGLGYYYEAAKEWLNKNEHHALVFLEDNPQVIHRLLETEMGTNLLFDKQVNLFLYSRLENKNLPTFDTVTQCYSLYNSVFSGIESYVEHRPHLYSEFRNEVGFFSKMHKLGLQEFDYFGLTVFKNFYNNYLELSKSHYGNQLFGKFKNVPAIICGAGPSLDKNIDILATLKDRALIFAGGTGLNALNAKGIIPHFGVGIDPNRDYFKRLLMNQGFEMPFIYRSRILNEGLEITHGEKLFVTGSAGYGIGNWLQKELGMEDVDIPEGFNVLNFSLSLASIMGCNPLICVGIDLAYSRGESYASDILSHPIHERKDFRTKSIEEDLLSKKDINGEPVFTLWKWMAESLWYSMFNQNNPGIRLINATEGGIGFPHVVNMPLAEVSKQLLKKQYAFTSRLHGEIQKCSFPRKVSDQHIRELLEQLGESLKKCQAHYQQIIDQLVLRNNLILSGMEDNSMILSKISEEEAKLKNEIAYEGMLKAFDSVILIKQWIDKKRLDLDEGIAPANDLLLKRIKLDLKRFDFTKATAMYNEMLIAKILQESRNDENLAQIQDQESLEKLRNEYPLPSPNPHDIYQYEGGDLSIIDSEMSLNFNEKFVPPENQIERHYYSSGSLNIEQYFKEGGELHGPSSYYDEDGHILARAWFIDGKQQGKMWTYTASGQLHSLQRFKDGVWDGLQQFYYPDGLPRSILPYSKGKLHGEVILYHPKGVLARRITFVNDLRNGLEQIWNRHGKMMIEACYASNRPVKTAKLWHSNGVLAKEVTYDENSRSILVLEWNEQGMPLDTSKRQQKDYFDLVIDETQNLTVTLENVYAQMTKSIPSLFMKNKEKESQTVAGTKSENLLKEQFNALHEEMIKLHALSEGIREYTRGEHAKEALWKNPVTKKELENQTIPVGKKMKEDIISIENQIQELIKKLRQQKIDDTQ